MSPRGKLIKRLKSYWQLEVFNAVLLPAIFIGYARVTDNAVGWVSIFCLIPMCALLVIGGLYWRAKMKALQGDKSYMDRVLAIADKSEITLRVLCLAALGLALAAWLIPDLARSNGDKYIATGAAVLAALEQVNYYHRQLQHFDHIADFKRLLTGRGFRPAQMAVDLKKWRERQSAP